MDPQKNTHLLFRRLISLFALADGWIDRWQGETPGTDAFREQFTLLSDMINALSSVGDLRVTRFSNEDSDRSPTAGSSAEKSEQEVKENPEEIRKILRSYLAEILWRLDHQSDKPVTPPASDDGRESDVLETAGKTHRIMSEYLKLLAARDTTFEGISSASPRQVYPE